MNRCRLCGEAADFHYGLNGDRADKTKLMLVLHRPDARISEYFEKNEGALKHSATGSMLDKILKTAGLDWPDVFITNFFKCNLPGDRRPAREEYLNCLTLFQEQFSEFGPRKIVVFGARPYKYLFPEQSKKTKITKLIETLEYRGVPCLVVVHPSQEWKKNNPDLQAPYINKVANFLSIVTK